MFTNLQRTESIKLDDDLIIESDRVLYERLKEDLTCIICYGLFKDPTSCSKCGTVFCRNCITPWLQSYSKCPLSCLASESKLIEIPKNVKKLINRIRLRCPKGCDVELLDYEQHIGKCGINTPIQCWNCGSEVLEHKIKEKVQNKEIKNENETLRKEIILAKKEHEAMKHSLENSERTTASVLKQLDDVNKLLEEERKKHKLEQEKVEENNLIKVLNNIVTLFKTKENYINILQEKESALKTQELANSVFATLKISNTLSNTIFSYETLKGEISSIKAKISEISNSISTSIKENSFIKVTLPVFFEKIDYDTSDEVATINTTFGRTETVKYKSIMAKSQFHNISISELRYNEHKRKKSFLLDGNVNNFINGGTSGNTSNVLFKSNQTTASPLFSSKVFGGESNQNSNRVDLTRVFSNDPNTVNNDTRSQPTGSSDSQTHENINSSGNRTPSNTIFGNQIRPSFGNLFGSSNQQTTNNQPSFFGNTNQATTNSQPSSLIRNNNPPTSIFQPSSLFGSSSQQQTQPTSGLLFAPSNLQTTNVQSGNLFSRPNQQTGLGSLFGSSNQQSNNTQTGSLFTNQQAGLFGLGNNYNTGNQNTGTRNENTETRNLNINDGYVDFDDNQQA